MEVSFELPRAHLARGATVEIKTFAGGKFAECNVFVPGFVRRALLFSITVQVTDFTGSHESPTEAVSDSIDPDAR